MKLATTRFGGIEILERDILTFADGLIGMEACRRWVLLADSHNETLGWLQSVDREDVALPVVSPRRFIPDYQVRVASRDVAPLGLESDSQAQVLVVMSHTPDGLTVNLKAPLVISLEHRCGRQVVAKDDHAVQQRIPGVEAVRRSA
ncbi:MAG: flagellar assembly protein FliW [Planctomycetota bacterium]